MRMRLLVAGLLLVALVNAVVLAGVAWNRSAGIGTTISLTERELPRAWHGFDENTGESLELRYNREQTDWFDETRLRALGFDVEASRGDAKKVQLPRKVFLVLEYDGPAWAALLRAKESAVTETERGIAAGTATNHDLRREREDLESMRIHASRLVPVDVGLDPDALRARYPDGARYLITAAEAGISLRYESDGKERPAHGYISRVLTSPIHLPVRWHEPLRQSLRRGDAKETMNGFDDHTPPRYAVTLHYGSRFEPWIGDVTPIPGSGTNPEPPPRR